MNSLRAALVIVTIALVSVAGHAQRASGTHDYPFQPVPFTNVHLDDAFWAPRIETNRHVTIPAAFQQCELSGRMNNFDRAAQALRPVHSREDVGAQAGIDDAAWCVRCRSGSSSSVDPTCPSSAAATRARRPPRRC